MDKDNDYSVAAVHADDCVAVDRYELWVPPLMTAKSDKCTQKPHRKLFTNALRIITSGHSLKLLELLYRLLLH